MSAGGAEQPGAVFDWSSLYNEGPPGSEDPLELLVREHPDRALLLYNGACGRCRTLSWLCVVLSFGLIRRESILSERAYELYRHHPEFKGRLAMVDGGEITLDGQVFGAVPRFVWRRLTRRQPRS